MFYKNRSFLDNFIHLMQKCNKIVLDIYEKDDLSISMKDDNSPLTLADQKVNECICDFLEYLDVPDSIIISEENKNLPYDVRKNARFTWLVDPIDGTKEFISKNGEFTINVGLCDKGVVVFGIVSIPVQNQVFYGIEDIGSFKLDLTKNESEILRIKKKKLESKHVKIT